MKTVLITGGAGFIGSNSFAEGMRGIVRWRERLGVFGGRK
jgi:nucleoside-diphosphate-sugar epimerase